MTRLPITLGILLGADMEYNLFMPSRMPDIEILEAALAGWQHQAAEIDRKMAEIRAKIRGSRPSAASRSAKPAKPVARKRRLSPAGKKRIAEANKKRWAAFRTAKATAS